MTTTDTRMPIPESWEALRAAGRQWAFAGNPPSILETLASLPQVASLRLADEIVRELAGRGFEIVRTAR